MDSAPLKCSVVVRAYNEGKNIGRLFTGIQQQTLEDVEVILVDSGSTDDTVPIAEKYGVKVVHINPEEFTFGRSLNRGIQAARGERQVSFPEQARLLRQVGGMRWTVRTGDCGGVAPGPGKGGASGCCDRNTFI